jgi:hypothetical protein
MRRHSVVIGFVSTFSRIPDRFAESASQASAA